MALQIDTVAHACNLITREIRDYQKNLTVHFIVYHEGQRTEALGLSAQDIIQHPASETAMHLLQKQRPSENSILLGTAVARQNLFFGMVTRDTVLALCTINIEQFDSLKEAKRHAYHLAWHALDATQYHSNPGNRTGKSTELIIRKRNALEIARSNLCADVFSSIISAFHRDKDAVRRIALGRGLSILNKKSLYSPEHYPFVIAMEPTEYALNQIDPKKISKKGVVPTALRVAREVGKIYDETTLKQWMSFAKPAQDMAWHDYNEKDILSAAINTSPDTHVRTNGYLISELTAIDPSSILSIDKNYSPFADDEFNKELHDKLIDEIYQDVIAQGLQQNSSIPFLKMAHQQNSALTDGKVLGWCASALHAAGKAYDTAKENGEEPEFYAAKEFKSKKDNTKWKNLTVLGKRVIKDHRQGHNVTLSNLKEIAEDIEGLKDLKQSVEDTIASPQYQRKLASADELRPELGFKPDIAPLAATPRAAPKTPSHEAVIAPGLGGSAKKVQQYAQTEETQE